MIGVAAVCLFTAPATGTEDAFILGVQTHYGQFWEPYNVSLPMVEQANIGWIRDEMYWTKMEEKKGTIAFPDYYRKYIDDVFKRKIQPLLIFVFNHHLYDGGRFPNQGEALEGYIRYCEFLVKNLPQVKIFEVWNEVTIDGKEWGRSSDAKGVADLLKTLYPRLKKLRPDLTIIGPNLYGGEPDEDLKKVLEYGAISFVDGISLHPYGNPDTLIGRLERLQGMLRKFNGGKDKPLYLTEFGWTTAWGYDTEHTQARSVARALCSVRSLPYVKGAWLYNIVDCTVKESNVWHPEFTEDNFGLVKNDYTPKPAYYVLRDIAPVISKGKFIRRTVAAAGPAGSQQIRMSEFQMPDGRRAVVAWQTDMKWGSWSKFKVVDSADGSVELMKLGSGTVIKRKLDADGTFPLFLEGDDIPWLIYVKGKGVEHKGSRWVQVRQVTEPKVKEASAKHFSNKPRIDGDLADWSGVPFADLGEPIWHDGEEKWQGKTDLSGRFAVGWDAGALYVVVEVNDNVHHQPCVYTDVWKGDGLQAVWVGPGDPRDDYVEMGLTLTKEGVKTVGWNIPARLRSDYAKALAPVESAVKTGPGKTVYEFAVPIGSGLLGDPEKTKALWKPELKFRFSLAVNDNDGKERRQALAWTEGIIVQKEPGLYGQVVLKP